MHILHKLILLQHFVLRATSIDLINNSMRYRFHFLQISFILLGFLAHNVCTENEITCFPLSIKSIAQDSFLFLHLTN